MASFSSFAPLFVAKLFHISPPLVFISLFHIRLTINFNWCYTKVVSLACLFAQHSEPLFHFKHFLFGAPSHVFLNTVCQKFVPFPSFLFTRHLKALTFFFEQYFKSKGHFLLHSYYTQICSPTRISSSPIFPFLNCHNICQTIFLPSILVKVVRFIL